MLKRRTRLGTMFVERKREDKGKAVKQQMHTQIKCKNLKRFLEKMRESHFVERDRKGEKGGRRAYKEHMSDMPRQ